MKTAYDSRKKIIIFYVAPFGLPSGDCVQRAVELVTKQGHRHKSLALVRENVKKCEKNVKKLVKNCENL